MITPSYAFVRAVLVAASLASAGLVAQQAPKINPPPASPKCTLKQRVGFTDIEVVYARPSVRGRKIFGSFLPYGDVWRTGANTSTMITFSTPVKIEGHELAAGSYALFSIPDAKEWTVIFNKVTGEWGAYTYKPDNDALRVKAKPVALSQLVETFTIDVNDIRTESATLDLVWEKTRVPIKIEFEVVQPVIAQIEAAMSSGATLPPAAYFTAASFYYDNNLDLQKARTWIDEATKGDKPPFYMLYWKAKILAKLGDKAGATAAARQSIAAAEGAPKAEYVRLNESLIASLK